ncbi:hypothetical protein KDA_43640 [Dictyobacter alpinus]|uniref:Uncharacterized protein n=1 Tax=Dictyobacter alpinus TaxID=2014873 RepID=A0A402BC51_9CHLR|nr:hypothetical protein KDA_43640 [Dictyobacter alpinus]
MIRGRDVKGGELVVRAALLVQARSQPRGQPLLLFLFLFGLLPVYFPSIR